MADKPADKKAEKDDPRIRTHYVMVNGERVPIKLRFANLDDVQRRASAAAAEKDAATLRDEEKAKTEAK